jgi:hypothetical protein
VIDHEALEETGDGTTYDRLTALLIGFIALLAAALVLVQTIESQHEARANAARARLTSELTSRISVSGVLGVFQSNTFEQALHVGIEGSSHSLVALRTGDAAAGAMGTAYTNASTRLEAIAAAMGTTPDETSGLDAYVASLLAADLEAMQVMAEEQAAQFELAEQAGRRSSHAVLAMSVAALSGVLVGLAAVVGESRAGKALLLIAYVAGAVSIAGLLLAVGVVQLPG